MRFLALTILFISINTNIPEINQDIIKYVDKVIGKKVARGECWDLAAAALDYAGAYLDRSTQKSIYIFGKEINPKNEQVFPGDIIQIENAKLEYTKDNGIFRCIEIETGEIKWTKPDWMTKKPVIFSPRKP